MRKVIGVLGVVCALAVGVASPAAAAPQGKGGATASTAGQDIFAEISEKPGRPPTGGGVAARVARATDKAMNLHRLAYLDKIASGGSAKLQTVSPSASAVKPTIDVVDCYQDEFAYRNGGFVIDHYNYCHATGIEVKLKVCATRIPILGCIRSKTIGTASWRMTTKGYGWDGTMTSPPNPVPALSQIYFVTLLDDFKVSNPAMEAMSVKLDLNCVGRLPALCRSQPGETSTTRTLAQWMADGGTFFRYLADPSDGTGRDKVTWFDFSHHYAIDFPGTSTSLDIEGNSYRCDEATYLLGERGCMFDQTEELFPLSLDSTANYRKAALHIFDAFYQPSRTKPDVPGKDVPGRLDAPQPRPLHRLYEPYDAAIVRDNRAVAISTCKDWWGDDYAQGGQFDCDEYPFASTYQGASQSGGNYSARVIDASDNRSAGAILGNWYETQRILHDDPFFVVLTTPNGGGGSGGQGGGEELPDTAPTVSAGPDVSAYEGSSATLRGAVRDLEGTPAAHWSYEIVSSHKAAMSCTLSNASNPITKITCNDEGTVKVTLTADDGINSPVSDSATVTVLNAPPQLGDIGPDPWAVFKARTPVALTAPFTDAGELDTHTCTVVWDDTTTDKYPAQSSSCDRLHTFAHAGMYTIKVTVTDDAGASDSATTMIVVYDPDAAFDNADGSIASPAGAWTAQPKTGGQMDFHLTANYYGTNTPTGTAKAYLANTTLRLDAGSTGLQWLVVTPDGKVAAKGTATINGQSGYGFVFYGYDGCTAGQTVQCQPGPDKFRILLWPLSSGPNPGDATVYDNRPDAGYDVDVADPQQLSTGTVTIHPPTA